MHWHIGPRSMVKRLLFTARVYPPPIFLLVIPGGSTGPRFCVSQVGILVPCACLRTNLFEIRAVPGTISRPHRNGLHCWNVSLLHSSAPGYPGTPRNKNDFKTIRVGPISVVRKFCPRCTAPVAPVETTP
eukprot:258578-Rhodomonas_salina.1